MRQKNWRFVSVGAALIVLSVGFFIGMMNQAAQSSDPVAMMRDVGEVTGFVSAISLAMIAVGLIGRPV